MAEIGAIASVTGVISFICEGCLFLKNLIGDLKNAPEELRTLRDELQVIENVVKGASVQDVSGFSLIANPALQQCNEAIAALKEEIAPALLAFSKSKSVKTSWERVKMVLGKQRTKQKLDRLSRAKETLLAAQASLSLTLATKQTSKINDLEISIEGIQLKSQESLAGITQNHEGIAALQVNSTSSLSLLRETATNTRQTASGIPNVEVGIAELKSQLTGNRKGISALQADSSTSISLLRHAEERSASISSAVGRVEDQVNRFQTEFSAVAPSIKESFQLATTAFVAQMLEDSQRHEALMGQIVATAMKEVLRNNFYGRKDPVSQAGQQDTILREKSTTMVRQHSCTGIRREPRYRRKLRKLYEYLLFDITIETFESVAQAKSPRIADELEIANSIKEVSYTVVKVLPKYRVFNHMFEFKRAHRAWGSLLDLNLRTYNVVSQHSPIFEAVRDGNLLEVRRLFDTRRASPYDIDEYGEGLITACLREISDSWFYIRETWRYVFDVNTKTKRLTSIAKLLIEYDARGIEDVLGMFFYKWIYAPHEEYGQLLRLCLKACKFDPFDDRPLLGTDFTMNSINHGCCGILLQQETWMVDWGIIQDHDIIWEGEWQILKDSEGRNLRELLAESSKRLRYWPFRRLGNPLSTLLHIISKQRMNTELVKACFNRLVILLTHGFDFRETSSASKLYPGFYTEMNNIEYNTIEYAICTNTVDIWEEALRRADWSEFDIIDMVDEARYLELPELFRGKSHLTMQEQRDFFIEFENRLVLGDFMDLSREKEDAFVDFYVKRTPLYSWNFKKMLHLANGVFTKRKLPGSWQDEEESESIREGEDPTFDLELKRFRKYADGILQEHLAKLSVAENRHLSSDGGEEGQVDQEQQEYALSQTDDETDCCRGCERTLEWLLRSYKIL